VKVLIGLDLGTTNTKAVAFEPERGQVVAVTTRATPYVDVPSGARETEPGELWQTVVACMRDLTGRGDLEVLAVGVAGFAEAGIPLDQRGQPLYNLIPWHDRRTEPQMRRIRDALGAALLIGAGAGVWGAGRVEAGRMTRAPENISGALAHVRVRSGHLPFGIEPRFPVAEPQARLEGIAPG
jgi:sugar (pentulose or hexulose) kinase